MHLYNNGTIKAKQIYFKIVYCSAVEYSEYEFEDGNKHEISL